MPHRQSRRWRARLVARECGGPGGGTLTLGEATTRSVNCAYARLIKLVGPHKVVDIAHRMGITNPLGAHLSLTLGSEPVTPLQMAAAYATLAAGGVRHDPYFVERVVGPDGAVLFNHADQPQQAVLRPARPHRHRHPHPGG